MGGSCSGMCYSDKEPIYCCKRPQLDYVQAGRRLHNPGFSYQDQDYMYSQHVARYKAINPALMQSKNIHALEEGFTDSSCFYSYAESNRSSYLNGSTSTLSSTYSSCTHKSSTSSTDSKQLSVSSVDQRVTTVSKDPRRNPPPFPSVEVLAAELGGSRHRRASSCVGHCDKVAIILDMNKRENMKNKARMLVQPPQNMARVCNKRSKSCLNAQLPDCVQHLHLRGKEIVICILRM